MLRQDESSLAIMRSLIGFERGQLANSEMASTTDAAPQTPPEPPVL